MIFKIFTSELFNWHLARYQFETFYSCANSRWATDAGLNVTWGPNGPRVRPHIDFDVYNGGKLRN